MKTTGTNNAPIGISLRKRALSECIGETQIVTPTNYKIGNSQLAAVNLPTGFVEREFFAGRVATSDRLHRQSHLTPSLAGNKYVLNRTLRVAGALRDSLMDGRTDGRTD